MCNLSEVEIFLGEDAFSTNRFRPKGLKERKGEMDKRAKDFSPLREIGVWIHFLPIDSFSTHRFRPKGLKEIRAKPLVWAKHRMAQPCDYL